MGCPSLHTLNQEEQYVQCPHHTLGDEHCNCAVQNVFTLKRWILKNNSLKSTSDSFYVNTGDDNAVDEVDYDLSQCKPLHVMLSGMYCWGSHYLKK